MENIFYDETNKLLKISDFSPVYRVLKEEITKKSQESQTNNDLVMLGIIAFELFYDDSLIFHT